MSMTTEEFDRKVKHLEQVAAARPKIYKIRVFLFALLGYAYIYSIFALGIALFVGLVLASGRDVSAGELIVACGGLVLTFLCVLWVRVRPPEGDTLHRKEAEELFRRVEELRLKLKAPPVHEILVTGEYNASISQYPRLGIFGGYKNYLVIGLPLMYALSPEQFHAVIAHEIGHLSGEHGRFGVWIYRVKATWEELMWTIEQRDYWASFVFSIFFRWYVPMFDAYSFVWRRANEYEADRLAAKASGGEHMAEALIQLHVYGSYLDEEYWPNLYKKAEEQLEMPLPYTEMSEALRKPFGSQQKQWWLERALAEETGTADTHPALRDRLRALGQEPQIPPAVERSAAEHFFGEGLPAWSQGFDQAWQELNSETWQARYEEAQVARQRFTELHQQALRDKYLTVDESWEYANLIEDFHGSEAALPLFRALLEWDANEPMFNFTVGRILLSRGEAAGIALIERAIAINPIDLTAPGCGLIYEFLLSEGREPEARFYGERGHFWNQKVQADEEERYTIGHEDTFIPHDLDAETVQHIQAQLASYPQIRHAYLVQKQLTHFPERPIYVLALVIKKPYYAILDGLYEVELYHQFTDELDVSIPLICILLDADTKKLMKKIVKVRNATIKNKRW